ncbi:MAG TPA: prenyltransferase/squalene oxidase repeat-containing protein, partial [Leptolinea sp.]
MAKGLISILPVDPLPALLGFADEALTYFVRRDLMDLPVGPIEDLWKNSTARQLISKQQTDGFWSYGGQTDPPSIPGQNYSLLETYRCLRVLVERYGFNNRHPAIQKTADYIFSCQTTDGDIRGIISNQYMPYYHGAILELLLKAGYSEDQRVLSGLEWLLSTRQDDGGWIVPAQAIPPAQRIDAFWSGKPVEIAGARPHSHLATGMALRAFAASPAYRTRPEVIAAGNCLKTRLFEADKYNDRKAPFYWLKFQFPFWWTSLVSALDTLSYLGFPSGDIDIARGLDWFITHQEVDGLWSTGYEKGRKALENRCWVGLAVCRLINRYEQVEPGQ